MTNLQTLLRIRAAFCGIVLSSATAWTQTTKKPDDSPAPTDNNPPHVTEVFNFGVLDPEADRIRARGQFLESWANARRTYIKSLIDQEKYYQEKVVTKIKRWEMHDWKVSRDWDQWQLGKDRILDNKIRDRDRLEKATVEVPTHVVGIAGGEPLNSLFEQIKRIGWSEMDIKSKRQDLPELTVEDLRLQWGTGNAKVKLRLGENNDMTLTFKKPREVVDDDGFNALLASYLRDREAVLHSANDKDRIDALSNSLDLLFQMNQALAHWYGDHKPKVNTDPKYLTRKAWSNFIDEQLKQMRNQSEGHSMPQAFAGKTVQELLDYMKRYGLKFAKADRGGENTYQALFDKMRNIVQDIGGKSN